MDGRNRTGASRTTRRGFLRTITAAGAGAAASGWLATIRRGDDADVRAASPMRRGGTLKIAEAGGPDSLDIMLSVSGLTSSVTMPMFEELFALDLNWRLSPSLVSAYTVSKDGLTYTFTLRSNVPFHNGKMMAADDVVACLNRWNKVSPHGAAVPIASLAGAGNTVTVQLKQPFAPLLFYLAFPNGAPAVMPKEIVDAAGTAPLKQFVGTGPYKFVEWAPDRYVHYTRFDQYAARSEPGNGMAGRKVALADELYYYPVGEVATRIAGIQSGNYDVADTIGADAYTQLSKDPRVDVGLTSGQFMEFIFNKKQGLMANQKLRQAIAMALDKGPIMQATFGDSALYSLDASFCPKGSAYYTQAGAELYGAYNVAGAKALASEAGYSGQPIRWMCDNTIQTHFTSSVVATTQLKQAGFNVDMQVMDWATVLDRRKNPAVWDVFVSADGFEGEPSLILLFNAGYPGWWDTPSKNALFGQFNSEPDPHKRVQLWAKLQTLVYQEMPLVRPGEYNSMQISRKGSGFRGWNYVIPFGVQASS
jgi:peptide/nickel transport system substrate-binding protein